MKGGAEIALVASVFVSQRWHFRAHWLSVLVAFTMCAGWNSSKLSWIDFTCPFEKEPLENVWKAKVTWKVIGQNLLFMQKKKKKNCNQLQIASLSCNVLAKLRRRERHPASLFVPPCKVAAHSKLNLSFDEPVLMKPPTAASALMLSVIAVIYSLQMFILLCVFF